jgi:two-component system response regulator NreC
MSDTIRLLLIDDHPVILDGLAAHLDAEQDMSVVARCTTPEAARRELTAVQPDVAVVDVKLQSALTFDLVAEAKAQRPELGLVFITGHEDDVYLERAFQSGAHAYVLKSEPLAEVVEAVRHAVRGVRYLSPETRQRFPQLSRAGADAGPTVQTRLSLLTKREREILHHVSQGRSAKEISEILKISTWTVTNHKANIMAKLDIHNQVGLTRFAVSTGLAGPS